MDGVNTCTICTRHLLKPLGLTAWPTPPACVAVSNSAHPARQRPGRLDSTSQRLGGPGGLLVPTLVPALVQHGVVFSPDTQGSVITVLDRHPARLLQAAPHHNTTPPPRCVTHVTPANQPTRAVWHWCRVRPGLRGQVPPPACRKPGDAGMSPALLAV